MTEPAISDGQKLGSADEFEAVLEFIRENRGFDFTGYKRPSLKRRVERRMQAAGAASYPHYLKLLQRDDSEYAALFDTILINVTAFFRDPEAWEFIREKVIPELLEEHHGEETLRFWSAGCATGEEAYSLAILLAEALGVDEYSERVKLYATDADEDALSAGRHGRYTKDQVAGVPPELLERYFEQLDGSLTIKPEVRRCVIFGRNDLLSDPPISRVGLVLARNTLMYFDAETQRRILVNFHFSLAKDGVLFLGKSEMLLTQSDFFTPVDLKRRVFRKIDHVGFGAGLRRLARGEAPQRERATGEDSRIAHATFETAPIAQLVIDRTGKLTAANVQARTLFGLTAADLGRPFQDLDASYRPVDLRSLVDDVQAKRHPVAIRDIEWLLGADPRYFDVQAGTLYASDGSEVGTSIAFLDVTRFRRLQDSVEHSKERVETAYEELQSTSEELETTNEELQSTNEELETTNEELQSTNEELETMNEELQSTNEELHTINEELRERTDEVHHVNTFLEAILGSLGSAVVVTDADLNVEAWNDKARDLWGLTAEEVRGQHLMNLDIGMPLDRVLPIVRSALSGEGELKIDVDAMNRRGQKFVCRVIAAPLLRPGGDVVSGVIVLMDELERAQEE